MKIPGSILVLIEKYLDGTASPEEVRRVNEWYHSFSDTEAEVVMEEGDTEKQLSRRLKDRLRRTLQAETPVKRLPVHRWWSYAAAALLILVLLSGGAYFSFFSHRQGKMVKWTDRGQQPENDIAPGNNRAVLSLANGQRILLDSAHTGLLTSQGNARVVKVNNGMVRYASPRTSLEGRLQPAAVQFNTLTTPRGGQYHLVLSDGTGVWLNASSSIRFPVLFTGSERDVEITGEVYFEVAENKSAPFKVKAGGAEIEVLGTHFNVNAYGDEAKVNVALLEGRVKVQSLAGSLQGGYPSAVIAPGEEARLNKDGSLKLIRDADVDAAIAWKEGWFQFKNADIKTIMRQIERWYDITVIYQGDISIHFSGQLPRNENISGIFEKLALTNEVHFRIEGKKVVVMP